MSTTSTTSSSTTSPTCTTPKPGKNGYLPPEACDVILYYVPSFAAAGLFCVLFGVSMIWHGVQGFMYKKVESMRTLTLMDSADSMQTYTWVIVMGALWELLAFVFRALLTHQQNREAWASVHTILFLLAPLWINAFLYMTLGRLIHFFIPSQRLGGIAAKRYGQLFVCLDIVAFIVQGAGAGMTSNVDNSDDEIMRGVHIYMGGIGLQELFILVFVGLAIHLHRRLVCMERALQLDVEKLNRNMMNWRWLFYAIYTALGMITVRIVFRLCQYADGTNPNNPVLTHEWYEYVWDAVPMFLALLVLNLVHPGLILQGPDSEFPRLSREEKKKLKEERKRLKQESKEADRTWKKGRRDNAEYDMLVRQEEGFMNANAGHTGHTPVSSGSR
ncbi:hypothetical protein EYZ11_009425 [Aspergillus tanneri]|uniref:RTA1 domain protein n=1 Tax=Aspergillus tanneri TaxID=1220188 RepID=A0A4S3JDB8_9EURO|nr:uncharacterized protein ATNIH1004_000027 [Aspergillus tanneri]KAA8651149.1 hypothetical protein ATNIH1004_000027 [Aspergillus tanneri]THC91111.1 hypothetical protein EYZ11_009425 [Aspergillus tanneri]